MRNIYKIILLFTISFPSFLVGMESVPLTRTWSSTALPSIDEDHERIVSMLMIDNKILANKNKRLRRKLFEKEVRVENGKKVLK